ncbi:MAG: hypothetical protein EPO40_07045 [Myxococcaceae bacterium]|nr:MAG: hypothetical protein EPO40_07045 [Myxococcaceae bacterium]
MSWLLVGTMALCLIPWLTSLFVEGGARIRWRLEDSREAELTVDGQGVFREATVHATVPAVRRSRAPGLLRAMAYSCWFLGQMVIPGFLVWCVGLLMLDRLQNSPSMLAMLASFFPGAVCAALLWRAGSSLVRGERIHADEATRQAATVIVAYNGLVIVAAGAWFSAHRHEEYLLGCVAYAVVSIVHVLAVRRAFVAHRDEYPAEPAQP